MNKKAIMLISLIAAFTVLFSAQAFAGFSFTEQEADSLDTVDDYFYCSGVGDADLNGAVEAADARLILRSAVGLDELTTLQEYRADVNRDGVVDSADARLALRISVGLEEQPEHMTEDIVVVPATCTTGGYTIRFCLSCGKVYSESKAIPGDHVPGLWQTVTAPTCTTKGSAELKCMLCGEVIETKELDYGDHTWGEWEYPDGKSCLDPVNRTRTCSVCEAVEEDVENPAGHHTFGWISTKDVTCTEDGELTYGCVNCGYLTDQVETVKATGHVALGWTVTKAANCTEEGEKTQFCVLCGEAVATEALPAKGHSFDNRHYQITLEPTCSETGLADVVCTACGERKQISVEKNPHTFTKYWEVTKEASCTETGLKAAECKYCGELFEEIPMLAHTEKWETVTAPTCSEKGLKHKICEVCKNELETVELDTLPHTYTETAVLKEPTCVAEGETELTCSGCGAKTTGTLPATGIHIAGEETVETKAPTCTADGYAANTCKYCGVVLKKTEKKVKGSALGHDFANYVTLKEATCTATGLISGTCTRCSTQQEEITEALGHLSTDKWETVKEATCKETGLKVVKCERCTDVLETKVIEKKAHVFELTVTSAVKDTDKITLAAKCSECGETEDEFTRITVLGGVKLDFTATADFLTGPVQFVITDSDFAATVTGVTCIYGKTAKTIDVTFDGVEYSFTLPEDLAENDLIRIAFTTAKN